jgi:hypothetical protein
LLRQQTYIIVILSTKCSQLKTNKLSPWPF